MPIKLQLLVVDDSTLMRRLISDLLESDAGIEVVDTARDGQEAIDKVVNLRPDVITMDVEMPRMDGLEAVSRIMQQHPTPIVMLTGLSNPDVAVEALDRGAVDFVLKPSGTISVDLYKVREELIGKVKLARLVNLRKLTRSLSTPSAAAPSVLAPRMRDVTQRVVVIGASTGGPRVVEYILSALPGDLPAAVLVIQHMPAGFTRSFAQRLDQRSALRVQEAEDGHRLAPGHAFVAPGDYHTYADSTGQGRRRCPGASPKPFDRPFVERRPELVEGRHHRAGPIPSRGRRAAGSRRDYDRHSRGLRPRHRGGGADGYGLRWRPGDSTDQGRRRCRHCPGSGDQCCVRHAARCRRDRRCRPSPAAE
ncbi:MAG: Chemotaxis response regulator protein-glutamate methylesterase [Anaerolineales bacterium]|nr:Chemotaxis response regulator protein-glutamate methylesterase [Anaerolineales bacterium]